MHAKNTESEGPSRNRSRHNQTYWQRKPYAAFGNGAASFVAGLRATRPRALNEYCAWIESGAPASMLELDTSQRDDLRDAMFRSGYAWPTYFGGHRYGGGGP